jgi:NTP pyrophosphatase (non-canonical NTP hydrolase)
MCNRATAGKKKNLLMYRYNHINMEIKELLEFIKTEHQRLMKLYNFKENGQLKYPITLKIMEELGELCEEVLSQEKIQRVEKLQNRESKIDEELADVLITTLLLAENMNIDVVNGLKKKIEKIKNRNY